LLGGGQISQSDGAGVHNHGQGGQLGSAQPGGFIGAAQPAEQMDGGGMKAVGD
jgi:hypothetical protein